MVDRYDVGRQQLTPLRPDPVVRRPADTRTSTKPTAETSFAEVLRRQTSAQPLKFSAHAAQRMRDRKIQLSETDVIRLQEAIERARAKGSRESLVMMDRAAFVVSVRNQTVITAVDEESMRQSVFTNIDSAVIV